jgi:hypothetical protein
MIGVMLILVLRDQDGTDVLFGGGEQAGALANLPWAHAIPPATQPEIDGPALARLERNCAW